MEPTRIPLFPLDVMPFPGATLPLHIFEPRYKFMVRKCVDNRERFGVILKKAEGIASIGCTAEIARLARTYPDGRMDILTVGREPYQVLEVFEEAPYLEAEVEYLEEAESSAIEERQPKLLDFCQKCHTLIYGRLPAQPDLRPGTSLAYFIANELPLRADHKQELLQHRAEDQRQMDLIQRLRDWLPKLERQRRVRQISRGNGHGIH